MDLFSSRAKQRGWNEVKPFFNPNLVFETVHLVSLSDEYDYSQRTRFGTLHVHPFKPAPFPWLARQPNKLRYLRHLYSIVVGMIGLRRVVTAYGVDLIVQSLGHPLVHGVAGLLVGKRYGVPVIITLHSDYASAQKVLFGPVERALLRPVWRWVFRNVQAIQAVSEPITGFAKEFGVSDKIVCIPNKERIERFAGEIDSETAQKVINRYRIEEMRKKGDTIFLTVGTMKKARNFERTLQAFQRATERMPSMYYLIAGDGILKSKLLDLVIEMGLQDKVTFAGHVPHSELICLYHLCDVFLFPTLYEGQPRALIEALAAKMPVICANYGQVCEVVKDGQNGLWVDPLDVQQISDAIYKLASDAELREKFREFPVDLSRFSVEAVSRREVDFYLQAIESFKNEKGGKR